MALLILNDSIGLRLGWCGLKSYSETTLKEQSVRITGYPAEKGFSQWTSCGTVTSIKDSLIYYKIDTTHGQSGSALVLEDTKGSPKPYVVGIHTSCQPYEHPFRYDYREDYLVNRGVHLTADHLKMLSGWLQHSMIQSKGNMFK